MIITEEQVYAMIIQAIEAAGSQTEFANQCGITKQYLGDILRKYRKPSDKVLAKLGIEKKTVYELKEN